MDKQQSNSARFLKAYNNIDRLLHTLYGYNDSTSFTEAVRKSSYKNYVVRNFQDDLIVYGRLRNSIVHNETDEVIAEPNLKTVNAIEKIYKLLNVPPKALNKVAKRQVTVVQHNFTLSSTIKVITQTGHTNIPVLKNNAVIGVINGRTITEALGRVLIDNGDVAKFIETATAGDVVEKSNNQIYYRIAAKGVSLEQVLGMFESNRKLRLVLITENGDNNGNLLGVVGLNDVLEMTKILNDYND